MGRRIDINDLVGAHEIAKRLELKTAHTIHVWRSRHEDFPKPIARLKTALIWDWKEVVAWIKKSGR